MFSVHGSGNCPHSRAWYGITILALTVALAACSSKNNGNQASATATQAAGRAAPAAAASNVTPAPSRPALPGAASTNQPQAATTAPATAAAAAPASATTRATATPLQAQIVEPKQGNRPSDPMTWTFTPNTINVPVGGSVTWTNTGLSSHTVTADDGNSFDSGAIERGDTWTFTFKSPGTFTYHCTFHNWMKGTVVVGG